MSRAGLSSVLFLFVVVMHPRDRALRCGHAPVLGFAAASMRAARRKDGSKRAFLQVRARMCECVGVIRVRICGLCGRW